MYFDRRCLLDEIEIKGEVQRPQYDDDYADPDAQWSGGVQEAEIHPEKRQQPGCHVEQHNTPRRRYNYGCEAGRDLDDAEAVEEVDSHEYAKRGDQRLRDDPLIPQFVVAGGDAKQRTSPRAYRTEVIGAAL